jgi:putative oxidoreductase
MTTTTLETTAAAAGGVVGLIRWFNAAAGLIPYDLVALAARVFPAVVFWQSGRTKVDGFAMKDSTWFLFQDLYALPLIPPLGRPSWRRWPSTSSPCSSSSGFCRGSPRSLFSR